MMERMRRCIALACLFLVACTSSTTPPGEDAGMEEMDAMMMADVPMEPPPPVCEGDTDPNSAVFDISRIEIPRPSDPQGIGGFNIDGLVTTTFDVPGCSYVDEPGGVDNAFAYTAVTIDGFAGAIDPDLDLYEAVSEMIEQGNLTITLTLQRWNGTVNDDAVGMHISIEAGSVIQEVLGCGRMTNGVVEGRFDLPVSLAFNFGDLTFSLELRSPRIRLTLSDDAQTIDVASSYLGGYILWDDGTPVTLPGELRAQVTALVPSNIPPALVNAALASIVPDLDGHPTLGVCVATETTSGVSSDSLSLGLRLGGARADVEP